MTDPRYKLTDKGLLVLPACDGRCVRRGTAGDCPTPDDCLQQPQPEIKGAFGELLVMWVGIVTAIGLTAALMLGWI